MAKSRNKTVTKLRLYRDKLMLKATNLEGIHRLNNAVLREVRTALEKEDYLRAYALASVDHNVLGPKDIALNDIAKELTLIYRILSVERKYSESIMVAAQNRDYLRVAALSAEHQAESIAHDKMLSSWSADHGFTRSIRKEIDNEDVI